MKVVISRVLTEKYSMLEDWMNNSKLVINPDKTHMMVMGTRKSVQTAGKYFGRQLLY